MTNREIQEPGMPLEKEGDVEMSDARTKSHEVMSMPLAEPTFRDLVVWDNGSEYSVETPKESYRKMANINGITISVAWDPIAKVYSFLFPEIDTRNDKAEEFDVRSEMFLSSPRPEVAKQVFEYASKLLKSGTNVYEAYRASAQFSKRLPGRYSVAEMQERETIAGQ